MPRRIVFAAVRLRSHHLFVMMLGILLLEGAALGVLPPPGIWPPREASIPLPPLTPAMAPGEAPAPPPARLGARAPDFSLPALDGTTVSLHAYAGRPVVLYFWASWCKYCQAHLQDVEALAGRHAGEGLAILAVNLLERPEAVREFVRARRLSLPVLLDADGRVVRQYQVAATPTAYFIDREGVLRSRLVGYDPQRFDAHLRQILAPPAR